jgi:hypothetical protein
MMACFQMASEDDKHSNNPDEVLTPVIQLQSKHHEEILNVIDQVRRHKQISQLTAIGCMR